MSKAHPRVFISYSWTSHEYQRVVIALAERLVHDGVDVVIDEWDLNPGHDVHVFMERCVNDETIDKVLILCNRRYAEKADRREGYVGIETAVITDEVYGRSEQEKFIPVVMERGERGEAFRPKYLRSRKYVDLSLGVQRGDYEGLLRCIYGKPRRAKPPLGTPPSWANAGRPTDSVWMRPANGMLVVMHDEPVGDGQRRPPQGVAAVPVRNRLSEYGWAELKKIADAIAAASTTAEGLEIAKRYNLIGADGKLGDERKPVTLTDGDTAEIRIAGFRHDELADDGGKAGITFEFADIPVKHAMNPSRTNEGGWEGSEMHAYLNGGFAKLLPEELRTNIATVNKLTNNKGYVGKNGPSVVSVTEDRLWLLSMSEVYGRLSEQTENVPVYPAVYDAEGIQYQLYRDRGVSTSNYGFCKKVGASSWWWLRSPRANYSDRFHSVRPDGVWGSGGAVDELGVSPGFCF